MYRPGDDFIRENFHKFIFDAVFAHYSVILRSAIYTTHIAHISSLSIKLPYFLAVFGDSGPISGKPDFYLGKMGFVSFSVHEPLTSYKK